MKRIGVAIAVVGIAAALAHLFGLTKLLGAHPFWHLQVLWGGAGIGLILGLLTLQLQNKVRLLGFVALAIGAFIAATLGKQSFAASFAENALAGKIWYFGWFATAAGTSALLFSCATLKKSLPR